MIIPWITAVCAVGILTLSDAVGAGFDNGQKTQEAALLASATEVVLEEGWAGLSPVSPIKARWMLRRTEKGWEGTGKFSAGGHFGRKETFTDEVSVAIPKKVWEACVRELRDLPRKPGPYKNKIFYTDSYPSYHISVRSSAGEWSVFSESQGEDHVPWALKTQGVVWVVENPRPAKAWRLLEPYLKKDRLEKLSDKAAGPRKAMAF